MNRSCIGFCTRQNHANREFSTAWGSQHLAARRYEKKSNPRFRTGGGSERLRATVGLPALRIASLAVVPRCPADFFDMTAGDASSTCGETTVWRQARQMRQEWRGQRYSRLKMA